MHTGGLAMSNSTRLVAVFLLAVVLAGLSFFTPEAWAQGLRGSEHQGLGTWRGRADIGIGVPPSSPLPYGVRPSGIFPPLGYRFSYGPDSPFGPARPFHYRPGDDLHRYQWYRQQLDRPDRYGINPLHQNDVYNHLRSTRPTPAPTPLLPGSAPQAAAPPPRSAGITEQPVPAEAVAALLRDSAARLDRSLVRRGEQAAAWRADLAPQTIIKSIDSGDDPRQLGGLLLAYDRVLAHSEPRWLMRADGFVQTRHWLRQYIGAAPPRP